MGTPGLGGQAQATMPAPADKAVTPRREPAREGSMKAVRIAGLVVGALCVLMGIVWIFQGINVIPGSFMTGDIDWSYRGGVLAIVGVVVLLLSLRKPRANGS